MSTILIIILIASVLGLVTSIVTAAFMFGAHKKEREEQKNNK